MDLYRSARRQTSGKTMRFLSIGMRMAVCVDHSIDMWIYCSNDACMGTCIDVCAHINVRIDTPQTCMQTCAYEHMLTDMRADTACTT